jgi:phage-related protein
VSVTWSGSTYLTLGVTCNGFNQNTGGSSAMALSIPNAQGACQAVVSEPTPASTTVMYTIAITPTGG